MIEMKRVSLMFCVFSCLNLSVFSQFSAELAERKGTFEILSRTDYTDAQSGFTKADLTANLVNISDVVSLVRQTPVLADIKGFNGRARIYTISHMVRCGYGVPSRISFEFSSFFYNKKGEVAFNTIEPPEWSLYINCPNGIGISSDNQDYEKGYFTVPCNKRTIAPGVDVYNDWNYVIYDPARRDYWIPVTVNEAFASAREFNAKEKDPVAAKYLQDFLEKEWNDIPAEYRDKPAYFGGGISRVTYKPGYGDQENIFPPIMKVNPAYWNKSLPKSAIQFITFQMDPGKKYLQNELDNCRKHTDVGSGCDLLRFEVQYDENEIRKLQPLIAK